MPAEKNALASTLNAWSVLPLILFGCIWAGFGITAFFGIQRWGQEYDRKMTLIAAHRVPAVTLYVVSIRGDAKAPPWNVDLSLRKDERDPAKIEDFEQTQDLGDLAVGRTVPGYQFDGKWFVPRFNAGGFDGGKWVFLGLGLAPPLIVAAIAYVVRRRKRARDALRKAVPEPPALPEAFTNTSLHFESPPRDEQLLALLGSSEHTSLLRFDETPTTLSARPGTLPLRFIVPWVVFVAIVITLMARHFSTNAGNGTLVYAFLGMLWLAILPMFFLICFALNRHLSAQTDYFQIDLATRVLHLPRAGVTLAAGAIESVVEVVRWFKEPQTNGWIYVSQIAVLARRAGVGVDYHLVLQDRTKRPFQKPYSQRLADALNVPVRRVQRTLRQSREFADAL